IGLPGRLVRLRREGPADTARGARQGSLLARVLRWRLTRGLPGAARPRTQSCARGRPREALLGRDLQAAEDGRQPVVLRLDLFPAARRDHATADLVAEPPDLPAGGIGGALGRPLRGVPSSVA